MLDFKILGVKDHSNRPTLRMNFYLIILFLFTLLNASNKKKVSQQTLVFKKVREENPSLTRAQAKLKAVGLTTTIQNSMNDFDSGRPRIGRKDAGQAVLDLYKANDRLTKGNTKPKSGNVGSYVRGSDSQGRPIVGVGVSADLREREVKTEFEKLPKAKRGEKNVDSRLAAVQYQNGPCLGSGICPGNHATSRLADATRSKDTAGAFKCQENPNGKCAEHAAYQNYLERGGVPRNVKFSGAVQFQKNTGKGIQARSVPVARCGTCAQHSALEIPTTDNNDGFKKPGVWDSGNPFKLYEDLDIFDEDDNYGEELIFD